MSLKMKVTHEFSKLAKFKKDLHSKHGPWSAKMALNDARKDDQDAVQKEMVRKLDRPTNFTLNAWRRDGGVYATKTRLSALVAMKPIQAGYLYTLFYGGTETNPHIVPGQSAKLNKYGNLPRKASSRKNTFKITSNGTPMVLQRTGKGKRSKTKVIGIFPRSRSYRELIDMEAIIAKVHYKVMPKYWDKWLTIALKTAR